MCDSSSLWVRSLQGLEFSFLGIVINVGFTYSVGISVLQIFVWGTVILVEAKFKKIREN